MNSDENSFLPSWSLFSYDDGCMYETQKNLTWLKSYWIEHYYWDSNTKAI
jgi:hypothetical protein